MRIGRRGKKRKRGRRTEAGIGNWDDEEEWDELGKRKEEWEGEESIVYNNNNIIYNNII